MQTISKFQDYNLRVPDVARLLGYHEQYVRFLAVHDKIPAIKRGRLWLFSESEIMEKFKRNTRKFHADRRTHGAKQDGTTDLLQ